MKILHTSDWHLGRTLYGRRRLEEFSNFCSWMVELLKKEMPQILIIAGDIFDTSTPGNRAQELYYSFLLEASKSGCRHIVITAGNHDSPTFLDAPRTLLKAIEVHVVGTASSPESEVITLYSEVGEVEAVVCAVPYLRDRDIRKAESGESAEDRGRAVYEGVSEHYRSVYEYGSQIKTDILKRTGRNIPLIATGHLFVAGGKTVDGDGVRELYIGSLGQFGRDIFPPFDYVALGHLHVPQRVDKQDHIRYSGSPIPMGFGEVGQRKTICSLNWSGESFDISNIEVPLFQKMARVCGDLVDIEESLRDLIDSGESVFVEIEYSGSDLVPDLVSHIKEIVGSSLVEPLRIINRAVSISGGSVGEVESIQELTPLDLFERLCDKSGVVERDRVVGLFGELLKEYEERDHNYEEVV